LLDICHSSKTNLNQDKYSGFKGREHINKTTNSTTTNSTRNFILSIFYNRLQSLIILSANHLKKKKSKFMVTSTHNHLRNKLVTLLPKAQMDNKVCYSENLNILQET